MSTLLAPLSTLPSLMDDDLFGFPGSFLGNRNWDLPSVFNAPFFRHTAMPAVNIKDNPKSYDLEMAVPGYKKDDLKVNVEDNILTISAEMKKESEAEKNGYTRREYSCSSFRRSFSLPENTDGDNVKASFADGVLKLSIPKTQAQPAKRGKEVKIG